MKVIDADAFIASLDRLRENMNERNREANNPLVNLMSNTIEAIRNAAEFASVESKKP